MNGAEFFTLLILLGFVGFIYAVITARYNDRLDDQ